jgi:hypothetical protein
VLGQNVIGLLAQFNQDVLSIAGLYRVLPSVHPPDKAVIHGIATHNT